jgi:hypothetical protein
VTEALRPRLNLPLDLSLTGPRPTLEVVRHTLRPGGGLAKLDALVACPEDASGVLFYFPGFNTPLGHWEMVKCRYLAAVSGMQVVLTEIPGMSRYGESIPKAVRVDMLRGEVSSWAELNLAYVAAAMAAAEVTKPDSVQVLGYSTGCSLATAALPALAEWGPISSLNLVEPVAISHRNIVSLHAHNMMDLGRMPVALATNLGHDWVMRAYSGERRNTRVKYGVVDLLAIATVLAGDDLRTRLDTVALQRCALARGSRSSLCRRRDFDQVDLSLAERGIAGPTITVQNLGHQLWHSLPTVTGLATAMLVTP